MTTRVSFKAGRTVWLVVFGVAVLATLIGLGNWQMRRLTWKEGLLARVAQMEAIPPRPLPPPAAWRDLVPPTFVYTPVHTRGTFEHDGEVHVFTVINRPRGGPHGGQGFWVMTPLELAGGEIVYVNRGFVPMRYKAREMRPEVPRGEEHVRGVVRLAVSAGTFTPTPDEEENIWYHRNPLEFAVRRGLGDRVVAPFFIDAAKGPPGALPQGGETRRHFPNNHLQYALTWYGLALGAAGGMGVLFLSLWRSRGA